jgi:methyl-accepting chemotaxis protein
LAGEVDGTRRHVEVTDLSRRRQSRWRPEPEGETREDSMSAMNLRGSSLKKRISLAIATIILVVEGTFSFVRIWTDTRQNLTEFDNASAATAAELASTLPQPLWDYNLDLVRQIVKGKLLSKTFVGVTIYDSKTQKNMMILLRDRDDLVDAKEIAESQYTHRIEKRMAHGSEELWLANFFFSDKAVWQQLKNSIQFSVVAFLVLSLVISLSLVFILDLLIFRAIESTTSMLKEIADGDRDLTRRIAVKNDDEIGQWAKWFNALLDNIVSIIRKIAEKAEYLGATSSELASLSDKLAAELGNIQSKAQNVSASSREMNANMRAVVTNAKRSVENVVKISASAEEMAITISSITQSTETSMRLSQNTNTILQKSTELMRNLVTYADQIEKIVNVTAENAEQTKLLSLHATIEAARAGSYGKGFAVVASEIKELAKNSDHSAEMIKAILTSVRNAVHLKSEDTREVNKSIELLSETISSIGAAIQEQSVATKSVAQLLARLSAENNEVERNIVQSATATDVIDAEIGVLNHSIDNSKNSGERVKDAADQLLLIAQELTSTVGGFKT